MVEIKSEENNTVQLPNNIRQVGTPGEKIKIYIEDYVYTYLNKLAQRKSLCKRRKFYLEKCTRHQLENVSLISGAAACSEF